VWFAAVPHVVIAPDLGHFVVAIADEPQNVKLVARELLLNKSVTRR